MEKRKVRHTDAGADVSKDVVDVEGCRDGGQIEVGSFENSAAGHKRLISWLTRRGRTARIVLEATGTYSLDLAVALHGARGVEVMVSNPRAIKDFARALMQRSKTDLTAATALREYCQRMEFVPWQPPPAHVFELRGIARRITALVAERTRELNRHHALRVTAESSPALLNDIEVNIRHLERRAELLRARALELIKEHADLRHAFDRITSIVGIADASGIQLLAELFVLPADMTVRQWVAHAGLDPRAFQSGTSVHKPAHISKVGNVRIRRALFMPAFVATKYNANVRAFFDKLIARGKKPLQAYVAVMRKLLHAIYGVLKNDQPFDPQKFYLMTAKSA